MATTARPNYPLVETRELGKRYGKAVAVQGISMRVDAGEVVGFLGPNGAGKTTVIKILLGLTAPTSGSGWLCGAPLGDIGARERVGYLPELFRYPGWLTAREVLTFHCKLARLARSTWRQEVHEALVLVGLAERADHLVATFSKGMQQRLGLAVALLGTPELVFLDEPTSALDPMGRRDVRQIISTLKDRGCSVFLNSHLLTEVERVCDRVIFVEAGRVIANGTTSEMVGQPRMRLRVSGLSSEQRRALATAGARGDDGTWLTVSPDYSQVRLIEAIYSHGGTVESSETVAPTLEDRFVELMSGGPRA